MVKATEKYSPAYLKEVMGLMCQKCTTMVTKCSKCGERFSFADRIYCENSNHICQNCFTRLVCSDNKKVE